MTVSKGNATENGSSGFHRGVTRVRGVRACEELTMLRCWCVRIVCVRRKGGGGGGGGGDGDRAAIKSHRLL